MSKAALTCPVCSGKGLVPHGFYLAIGTDRWSGSSTTPETCRSCNGTGIVFNASQQYAEKQEAVKQTIQELESQLAEKNKHIALLMVRDEKIELKFNRAIQEKGTLYAIIEEKDKQIEELRKELQKAAIVTRSLFDAGNADTGV